MCIRDRVVAGAIATRTPLSGAAFCPVYQTAGVKVHRAPSAIAYFPFVSVISK